MPRIRSIKPDFFKSEDVAALPLRARLLWIGLWTQCDDHGRYKDSARLIKGDVWPLDDVSLRDIEEDLSILEQQRRLVRYEVDGKKYLVVVNWHAHQAINRPSRPKHPAPPLAMASADPDDPNHCDVCAKPGQGIILTPSVDPHVDLSGPSPLEGKGKEGKGGDARAGVSVNPHAPPSERCPQHQDDPDPPNCGRCADARRARQRWDAAVAARERAAPRCRIHRGEPAHNCGRCRSEQLAGDRP
jgi:hypothetical protein